MKWDVTGTESLKREMTITGLPVARPAQINELYWMVSRAAKTLYDVWTVFWQARRARKLQVYTIPRHSCSPLNSIGRSSNCWVLFYCWYVRSISFSQNSLLRALRESSDPSSKTIAFQFRSENERVRAVKTVTQNLVSEGPLLQLQSNLLRDHLS